MSFSIPCGLKTFCFMKEFKTIDDQINLLIQRGVIVTDIEGTRSLLLENNYYNVVNGYKDIFLEGKNTYRKGTTFEEIFALYEFDKNIRSILLTYILGIENKLRSLVAYYFSKYHGNDNYLTLDNFDNLKDVPSTSYYTKQQRTKSIQDLITSVQKKISATINSKEYIKHYIVDYGFVPMWVLVNTLSFGEISKFLELMKQKERIEISKFYNIKENDLVQYIKLLAFFRNLCAHDERIYNVKVPKYLFIPDNKYHEMLELPKNNDTYKYGKNDLFAVLIALKVLLSTEDYNTLYNKFFGRVKSLENKLTTIDISDVLKIMNFPENWCKIKKF